MVRLDMTRPFFIGSGPPAESALAQTVKNTTPRGIFDGDERAGGPRGPSAPDEWVSASTAASECGFHAGVAGFNFSGSNSHVGWAYSSEAYAVFGDVHQLGRRARRRDRATGEEGKRQARRHRQFGSSRWRNESAGGSRRYMRCMQWRRVASEGVCGGGRGARTRMQQPSVDDRSTVMLFAT